MQVARDAFLALINLSAASGYKFAEQMIELGVLESSVETLVQDKSPNADQAAMLLGNLTRDEKIAAKLCEVAPPDGKDLVTVLAEAFCRGPAYNPEADYHYLGNVLFNISQITDMRKQIMKRAGEGCVFQRLLPFTVNMRSVIRRGGVIGCIKNCCLSSNDHSWLLSDEVNILPNLLLLLYITTLVLP